MTQYLRFFTKTMVLLFSIALLGNTIVHAQISGSIFRDFNANGQKDNTATFNEPFLAGVTITATPTTGLPQTILSAANGTYSFTGLTLPVRIEFSGFASGDFSAPNGVNSKSSVQFYTIPATNANFGVNYPDDYCNNNPFFASNAYVSSPGTNGINGLAAIPYGTTGTGAPLKQELNTPYSTIGSVWGMAHQRESNTLFSSAFMKRHTAFGSGGTGAIYATTGTNTPAASATLPYINLQTLAAITTGPNTHATNLNTDANNVNGSPFDAVGKVSLGDMDVSSDGKYLFVVNLFEKKLHRIFIDNPAKPAASLTAADVSSWNIPTPCNATGTSRPWGLAVYRGKVYVGVVCDASVSLSKNDLSATVYEMDPANGSFTAVLNFPLDYLRGAASANATDREYWNAWRPIYYKAPTSPSYGAVNPQPILSDIDFDTDGSMILGFTDRSAHQLRMNGPIQDGTGSHDPRLAGDLLRAGKCGVANLWTIENNASVCGRTPTAGAGNTQGPGGGEFYFGEQYDNNHFETSQGAVAMLRGSNQVVMGGMDPLDIYSAGFYYMNSTTGNVDGKYELVPNSGDAFGKAGAIGDVEMLCLSQPIEIGNRVFLDNNKDGIQDPNENGIASVIVDLYEGAIKVGTTTTAADGSYYFTNANVNLNGATGLKYNTNYEIRIATSQSVLVSKAVTLSNINSNDLIDSDASVAAGYAKVTFTTGLAGQNNHSYDFGFTNCDVAFAIASTNITCFGNDNGTITVTASGGLSPYQYSKDAGVSFQNSNIFNNLVPSTYNVWVKDSLGCIKMCN